MARNIHSYYNHHNNHKDDDNDDDDDDDCDKADDWVIGLPRLHSSSSLAPSTLHSHCHHHSSHHCHHHHHNYHHHEYSLRKIIFYIMCCILISTMRGFQVGPNVPNSAATNPKSQITVHSPQSAFGSKCVVAVCVLPPTKIGGFLLRHLFETVHLFVNNMTLL